MKHIRLIIFFFVCQQSLHAQENYIQYHREILNCETDFLFKENINDALKNYKTVFERYSKPFAKDCFIALQLACFANDTEDAKYFFKKSFCRGLDWIAVDESACISKVLKANPVYKHKIKVIYEQEHGKFLNAIDTNLRNEIIRMKQLDDSTKITMNGMPNGYERDKRDSSYMQVLRLNTIKIIELTRRNGFISDNRIGYMDHDFLFNNKEEQKKQCYQLRSFMDQLFYHNHCCYFMLESELQQALKNGEILPAMYASIYEWAYLQLKKKLPDGNICNPNDIVQTKYFNMCPVLLYWATDTDIKCVNICRKEIGLGSVQHYEKKKEFEKMTGIKLLFGMFDTY